MRSTLGIAGITVACLLSACSQSSKDQPIPSFGGSSGSGASAGTSGGTSGMGGSGMGGTATGGAPPIVIAGTGNCPRKTCAELGWKCGYLVDECEHVINCADEGLACAPNEVCIGGVGKPTECVAGGGQACALCTSIPNCTDPEVTRLTGRVVTPGRDDANTPNQVGVPNAIVYIMQTADPADIAALPTGIPAGGTSCDRCEDQDLGPVLNGTVTDATGKFTLENFIPVGSEFLLVVKAGRFRRATKITLPATAACQTTELPTTLPDNPTRLPRTMMDGLAVNIPRFAVATGQVDAMECVLEKMGLAATEFGNGAGAADAKRVHLYRGGSLMNPAGASIDAMTPHSSTLYSDVSRLEAYDVIIADCEGTSWDSSLAERDADGAKVREVLNRGGRMFASHLSFTWLHENGTEPYTAASPFATGLAPAATWTMTADTSNTGMGAISIGRPGASPRVQNFADWMVNEGITTAPGYGFTINEPRSQNTGLGANSEEFVFLQNGTRRVQQFSFNTPYGAPKEAVCGRVAYSGFHVSVGGAGTPFADVVFPTHCAGNLTVQEKVLLYMLFDLGACIGVEPPPMCTPATCESLGASCGFAPDGCGKLLDCGPCRPPL